jgi:hypothetical protein
MSDYEWTVEVTPGVPAPSGYRSIKAHPTLRDCRT